MMEDKIISELRKRNPYPDDIFIKPTKEEIEEIREVFEKKCKKSFEGLMGSEGRRVWNLCCDELKIIIKGD